MSEDVVQRRQCMAWSMQLEDLGVNCAAASLPGHRAYPRLYFELSNLDLYCNDCILYIATSQP